MNVVSKITCYFERSVVTLKLRKECLHTVSYNTSVLFRIKYRRVWYIERYSMSTYTGVTNVQKTVRFFGPPCTTINLTPSTKCRIVTFKMFDESKSDTWNPVSSMQYRLSKSGFLSDPAVRYSQRSWLYVLLTFHLDVLPPVIRITRNICQLCIFVTFRFWVSNS